MLRRGAVLLVASLSAVAPVAMRSAPTQVPRGLWARPWLSRSAPVVPRALKDPCAATDPTVECSQQWSGYVAFGQGFTDVRGTWVEPSAACPATGFRSVLLWVGIGGEGTDTLEQLGTEADCQGGTAFSGAWSELYPADTVSMSGDVEPGDVMTAEVRVTGKSQEEDCTDQIVTVGRHRMWERRCTEVSVTHFRLSLSDGGHALLWGRVGGWSHSVAADVVDADLRSAEWIAESPSFTTGGVATMTAFGSVPYSGARAADATATGSIAAFLHVRVLKTALRSNVVEALPGPLTAGGSGFSVTRVAGTPGA